MMISSRDTLFVAPSRTPAVFAREVEAILDRSEVDMEPVRRVLYDTPMRCAVAPGDLLHRGEAWTRLDYTTVNRTDHDGKASWVFDAGAEVAGLALWFETEFGNGARFSTAPGSGLLAYSQVFLPLESVVAVPAGGALSVELGVRLAHENYIWSWRTAVRAPGTAADLRATAQNSLAEVIIDPHAVPLTSMAIPSSLGPRGRALHALLDGVSQHHSGFDLARRLHSAEPTEFPNMEQAEAFVAHWLAQLEKLERGLD